jgi:hypothetical protein
MVFMLFCCPADSACAAVDAGAAGDAVLLSLLAMPFCWSCRSADDAGAAVLPVMLSCYRCRSADNVCDAGNACPAASAGDAVLLVMWSC